MAGVDYGPARAAAIAASAAVVSCSTQPHSSSQAAASLGRKGGALRTRLPVNDVCMVVAVGHEVVVADALLVAGSTIMRSAIGRAAGGGGSSTRAAESHTTILHWIASICVHTSCMENQRDAICPRCIIGAASTVKGTIELGPPAPTKTAPPPGPPAASWAPGCRT